MRQHHVLQRVKRGKCTRPKGKAHSLHPAKLQLPLMVGNWEHISTGVDVDEHCTAQPRPQSPEVGVVWEAVCAFHAEPL